MSEKMWLVLDADVFHRAELKGIDADMRNVYLMLLLRAARNPWWDKRPDVVPCDKDVLAKATGCNAEAIRDALNAFRRLGLVKLVNEKQLHEEEDGSSDGVPAFEEVQAFAAEEAPNVDAQKFYGYYAATEFMWKGKPIDWRAKLREWQKTERPKPGVKKAADPKEMAASWETRWKALGLNSMDEYLQYVQAHI